jgi:glycosyltransferase involved in cell wall biosynthesis
MAIGVPVVATAVGAIPEVVGDGALLIPPGDRDALAGALTDVLADEDLRDRLIERGRERAALFTWESCARGLADLYVAASESR